MPIGILRNLSLKRKASLPNYEKRLLLNPSVSETTEKPNSSIINSSPYWKRCLSLPSSTNAANKLSLAASTPPASPLVHADPSTSNVSSCLYCTGSEILESINMFNFFFNKLFYFFVIWGSKKAQNFFRGKTNDVLWRCQKVLIFLCVMAKCWSLFCCRGTVQRFQDACPCLVETKSLCELSLLTTTTNNTFPMKQVVVVCTICPFLYA